MFFYIWSPLGQFEPDMVEMFIRMFLYYAFFLLLSIESTQKKKEAQRCQNLLSDLIILSETTGPIQATLGRIVL